MAYTDLDTVRAKLDLGLADENLYPDSVVESLIDKAGYIIDGYLGQTILADGEDAFNTVTINAIPNAFGGLHVQFPRRFILEIEDDKVLLNTGFGASDIEITSTSWQLNKDLGYLDTSFGSVPSYYFDNPLYNNYLVTVSYRAGFDILPSDFMECYWYILGNVKGSYDNDFSPSGTSAVSSKVIEYRTLNETVKYAEDTTSGLAAKPLLENWVKSILNKYKMPSFGIGVRF